MTILVPELATKLGIERAQADQGVGAGGSLEVHLGTVKSLAVGETSVQDLPVGIMDLSNVSKALMTDIDGVIGYNFLREFRVVIDYPKQTVMFE